ncbi:MAG: glycine--tRNA ligase subunit beta [Candidatus Melainabacteria bacterium]|nr:glycine--tRNA ligase subunit beta [Candidatus Melainabacteria bacterium]
MTKYLLEIGTEELPAGQIEESCTRLEENFASELREANLSFSTMKTLSTPRRLTLIIDGLGDKQETISKKVKGPPVNKAFKEDGSATPQAEGFAAKNGLKVDQLDKEEYGKEVYLVANLTIEGRAAAEVLAEIAPRVIHQISGERLMRWGDCELKFVRPIRWIVSLLDNRVVNFKLDQIAAGQTTFGHRILAPGEIKLGHVDEYVEKLRAAKVLVCPQEREDLIRTQVSEIAESVLGKARQLSGPLLQEVVNITEWPQAIVGKFAEDYLTLPDTLLETVMVHHQRYFPVEKPKTTTATTGNLLPYFITISNNDTPSAVSEITQGNERVLRARLADGKFFFFDDQKTKLSARKDRLGQLTFQQGLGSYLDKTNRLTKLANKLSEKLKLEAKIAVPFERTMELCKLDLVTNLVGELTELQGYVGAWYAELEGEPPEVVQAIASHYSPRFTHEGIPADVVGRFVALLDKLDHVVGLFALGKKPSGSSDPFALRRNAQGLVDIIMDGLNEFKIDLEWLSDELLDTFEVMLAHDGGEKSKKKAFARETVKADFADFISQRLRGKLLDKGFGREIVEAVLSNGNPLNDLADTVARCRSAEKLFKSEAGITTARAGVRIGNILKSDSPDTFNPGALTEPVEKELWKNFNEQFQSKWEKNGEYRRPTNEQEYDEVLALLAPLAPHVDKFFEDVMVNDPDKAKRDTRHGLLKRIDQYYSVIASFPKLQPLLP